MLLFLKQVDASNEKAVVIEVADPSSESEDVSEEANDDPEPELHIYLSLLLRDNHCNLFCFII